MVSLGPHVEVSSLEVLPDAAPATGLTLKFDARMFDEATPFPRLPKVWIGGELIDADGCDGAPVGGLSASCFANQTSDACCPWGAEEVRGTDGADLIESTSSEEFRHQEICVDAGGGADDILSSSLDERSAYLVMGDGNDYVTTYGRGSDIALGGMGDDVTQTRSKHAAVFGGEGDDCHLGRFGFGHGGDGADLLINKAGRSVLMGGGGDDLLVGGRSGERFYPGGGTDVVDAGPGRDKIVLRACDSGPKLILGGPGKDVLRLWGTIEEARASGVEWFEIERVIENAAARWPEDVCAE